MEGNILFGGSDLILADIRFISDFMFPHGIEAWIRPDNPDFMHCLPVTEGKKLGNLNHLL